MTPTTLSALIILGLVPAVWGAGTTAGALLTKSPNAQPSAMAEAYTSVGVDEGGLPAYHYNPGAAAFLRGAEIALMGQKGFADDTHGTVFFGAPTRYGQFSGSLLYYSVGSVELISSKGDTSSVSGQRDLAATFNYADLWYDRYATGITVKALRTKLLDAYEGSAVAADIGAQMRFLNNALAVGVSFNNFGTRLKYLASDEQLPQSMRAGASYRWHGLLYSADIVKELDEKFKIFQGLEYNLWNIVQFRFGYKMGQEIGKISFGLGFRLGKFQTDFSMTNNDKLGSSQNVSLLYRFGPGPGSKIVHEEY